MHKRSLFISAIAAVLLVLSLCGCMAGTISFPNSQETTDPAVQADAPLSNDPAVTELEPTEPPSPPDTTLPEGKAITAHHGFVYDTAEKRLLFYSGDPDSHVYPASITKLMTAYVVQKYMTLDETVTVGEEVTWIDPYSSVAGLLTGDTASVELLIYGMMLPSGNDAAYALAVACGRVIAEEPTLDRRMAYGIFVDEMNAEARILGMQNTHYMNPDGNHEEGHYTSVNDLIILVNTVLDNDLIMDCARTTVKDASEIFGRSMVWSNSNQLLSGQSQYYAPEAVGLKTGSTSAAGACLVSLFTREDGYLLVGVLGSDGNDNRYLDTLLLYELYK